MSGAAASEARPSGELVRVFQAAEREASALKDEFISTEHLLLALAGSQGEAAAILQRAGATRDAILAALERGARPAPRDRPEPRGQVPGARALRPRPHRARRAGQARSGDRPRRGDPPRDPGALAAHEEQPRADRRARRRQDRDRRGPRAAHRLRRRARVASRPARGRARHRRADRRREVPRRVRGPAEGGAQGDPGGRGPDHRLHRRAPHDRRRGRGRGRGRRREHAEADARARRAARGRRDHARRVPQAHREGRGAGAPLPAGDRRRAVRRGHDRDPARAQGALRGAPRRAHPGLRDRRGGDAVRSLHRRPLPARQGDRPDRRGRLAAAHRDRLDADRDRRGRAPHPAARDRAPRAGEGEGRRVGRAAARRSSASSPTCASARAR